MRPAHARALSYSIVASLAGLAIWFTPSLGAYRAMPVAPVVVVHPEMPMTDYVSSPMMVYAPDGPIVDTVAVAGIIHESLFASLDNSAQEELPPAARHGLAYTLANIFQHKADLTRDLDEGDRFHVLVERLSKPNGAVIINKVLGAKFGLSAGQNTLEAVRFDSKTSSAKYFDANGKSLTPSFLKVPVAFRRISSGFGNRFHPILGRWKHHDGTDYAAAMGTPVKTIGDGTIIFAGWKGGYGNTIEIRHRNGMVTRYGHMRKLREGNAHRPRRFAGEHDRVRRLDGTFDRPAPPLRSSRRRARRESARGAEIEDRGADSVLGALAVRGDEAADVDGVGAGEDTNYKGQRVIGWIERVLTRPRPGFLFQAARRSLG